MDEILCYMFFVVVYVPEVWEIHLNPGVNKVERWPYWPKGTFLLVTTYLSVKIPIYSVCLGICSSSVYLEICSTIDNVEDNKRAQFLHVAPTILYCHCSPFQDQLTQQFGLLHTRRCQASRLFRKRPWPLFPGPSWVPATMCVSAEWPVCQPFPSVGIRVHLYKITCLEEGRRSYWQVKKRKGNLSFKLAPLKGCKWPMIFDKNMLREFILHTTIKDLSKHNRFEIYHTKICSIFIS